jgi:hypothetical protein
VSEEQYVGSEFLIMVTVLIAVLLDVMLCPLTSTSVLVEYVAFTFKILFLPEVKGSTLSKMLPRI